MSEWASLKIKNLELTAFRNYLDNKLVSLFFSEDCLKINRNVKIDPEDAPFTQYLYETSVKNAKERFDALGITTKHFKEIFFNKGFNLIDYSPFLLKLNYNYEDYESVSKERYQKYITYSKWRNSLEKIIKFELINGNIRYHYEDINKINLKLTTESDKIIFSVLSDFDCETSFSYGLNIEDFEFPYLLRQILDFCDDNEIIELDFSYLQYWDEDCIPKALELNKFIEKTIVLVEGTSDKDILEFSLEILYPHLKDLFYFMDFDGPGGVKRDGGTSYLVKNMKTFYFSKLKAQFVAIFDNDAEGYQSKMSLLTEIKNWPSNMKILCYPELKEFERFRTLSPNGKIELTSINKKACSIELYLPDFLIKKDNLFYPIIWESRKEIKYGKCKEFLYQGVIQNKEIIKKDFIKYRNKVKDGKASININEWSRMKKLLKTLVFSFK